MGLFRRKKKDNSIENIAPQQVQAQNAPPKPRSADYDYYEEDYREAIREHRKRRREESRKTFRRTIAALIFAALFLMPTVLTITNSFMTASEISANYGSIFASNNSGGKVFVSETVNLKFIPDMVTFSQYITVLF
ncbi:MAG: hypothetical protein Q4F25_02825, partial [Eubacteriales bacterium]|nr:hypothetical protein [Eubacteriales bacterium]